MKEEAFRSEESSRRVRLCLPVEVARGEQRGLARSLPRR
jgi:hypothetical protein